MRSRPYVTMLVMLVELRMFLAEGIYLFLPFLIPISISFLNSCIQLGSYGFSLYCAENRVRPKDIRSIEGGWNLVRDFVLMEFQRSLPIAIFSYGIWAITTAIDIIWLHSALSRAQIAGLSLSVVLMIIAPGFATLSSWASVSVQLRWSNIALSAIATLSLILIRQ